MAETIKFATNVSSGISNEKVLMVDKVVGTIDADSAARAVLNPIPFPAKITNIWLGVGTNGVDSANALSLKATVKKNGTAVASTDPAIAKAAGTGQKDTYGSGTGITQTVLKTDGTATCAAGDYVTVDFDITRTAGSGTPETEITDPCVVIEFTKLTA